MAAVPSQNVMVRAYCPCCDLDVDVCVLEVTVVYGLGHSEGEYLLDCPRCDGVVRGRVHSDTIMALATAGARLVDPDQPLTEAEIERFVEAVDDVWLAEREIASFAY